MIVMDLFYSGLGRSPVSYLFQRFFKEPRKSEGVDGAQDIVENTEEDSAGKRQKLCRHIDGSKGVKDRLPAIGCG